MQQLKLSHTLNYNDANYAMLMGKLGLRILFIGIEEFDLNSLILDNESL